MIFLGPKIVEEEQIWSRTWRRRRGFVGFRRIPVISWDFGQFSRFCRIPTRFRLNYCSWFAGITVEDMLGTKKLLLRAFWEKVPALRNFETLRGYIVMYKFNCTRQLHESIVVMWLCKCECRTHRESALSKTNFKVPKLIKSQPSSDFKHVACIKLN
jgi:hypothetical protein